jgi:Uma2 family endonuclease
VPPTTAPSPFIGLALGSRVASFRRFTVPEYHRLIDIGILTEDDDLELLDGHLVRKMSRKPPHDGTLKKAEKRLLRVLPPGWDTRAQMGLTLSGSEPEPDIVLARDEPSAYTTRHPTPADTGLVVEVSDTTLDSDRSHKSVLYGHAGIAEYWIVNVADRQVEVYSRPTGPTPQPGYANRTDYLPGQTVPLTLDGRPVATIPVDDLLP